MSCPICHKPSDPAYRPFCTKRCADVDLAHWLRGSYAIPADDSTLSDEDEPDTVPTMQKPH